MYQKLLEKNISLVMAITGGGAGAIGLLTKNGGASKILLEAHVPYSAKASSEYAGKEPEQFCSRDHALNLAVSSYNRARAHATGKFCIGLGSTARLVVDNERKGRVHEAWIAIHDDENTRVFHVYELPYYNRRDQEDFLSTVIIRKLAESNDIDTYFEGHQTLGGTLTYDSNEEFEQYIFTMVQCKPQIFKHLYEDKQAFELNVKGKRSNDNLIVFPGSFAPIHSQHKKMAEIAYKLTGKKVVFELCVRHTHKPPLDYLRLVERYEALSRLYDEPYFGGVLITNTPFFVDKARVSGFSHFMCGLDTAELIHNMSWSKDLHDVFVSKGAKILVFPRIGGDEPYISRIKGLFEMVPSELYVDNGLSSTQLRKESNVH